MKIAIICDWLVTLGGAEKCLAEFIHCFPTADLYAVVDFLRTQEREFLRQKKVTTTFIQKLPWAKKYYRSMLPCMPLAIEQLDLSAYDLIISSSHAVAKGVITGPDQIHISYVHSPMRYAWDLQHHYLKESGLDKKMQGWLARYFLHKLRLWDLRTANNVDHFIANSQFIARRIQKTYRRDATVIYPPVDIAKFSAYPHKEDFYLAASRLVPYKKIDLIVESFRQMPDKKLIVIGDGPDFAKIKNQAGANVTLLGYQSTAVLIEHMQRAKALLFAAEDDFGLIPVEAQACGTPVIAYGKGGALETIRSLSHEKPTGLFFSAQTSSSLIQAIREFEGYPQGFAVHHCVENATRFSTLRFRAELLDFVAEKTAKKPYDCAKNPA